MPRPRWTTRPARLPLREPAPRAPATAAAWSLLPALLPALLGACERNGTPADPDAPTFVHVAPIVHANCAPCHRPGEPVPFPLLTYDDVFRRRRQIARVVQRRLMPPWLPAHGDFVGDRRLDERAIDTIVRWVATGAPPGDPAAVPPPPSFPDGWQLGEPDLVVTAPEAVEVPADGPDRFRNLVIPVAVDGLRHVEAVEIRPGSAAVHHAILRVDATRESRRLDALDPEPGFPGMGMGLARAPDGHFLGWTPGKRPHVHPPGMAWRLWPGSDLVLQVHLTPTGRHERVRPRIGLHFTDVPTEIEPLSLVLWSEDIDIPAGASDHVVADHLVLPVPVTVHALYPHAHHLCRRMLATATLPEGRVETLLRIDAWDFDWQDDYRYQRPLELPAGTRLAFEYRYDNSPTNPANPNSPPRRVTYGLESTDEMGTLTLTVEAADRQQTDILRAASARRDVERAPANVDVWLNLVEVLRDLGESGPAAQAAREAARLRPDLAGPRRELGICLETAGRLDEAERELDAAVALDPHDSVARMHLGGILARSGRERPAIEHFRRAVAVHPNLAPLHNNLATALFAVGELDEAAAHYRHALALRGDYFNARFNLGRVLAGLGRIGEARRELELARRLRPDDEAVRAALQQLPPR